MKGFDDSYFEHYCKFDNDIVTPYSDSEIRFYGNRDIHKYVYSTYKNLFKKEPNLYLDLGCGTGEEISYFLDRNITSSGCDISDYVFNHINKKAEPFITKQDSVSFLSSFNGKADILMDSVLQYLDDDLFEKQIKLIGEKTNDNCVIGVIYDWTERNHPYRKQVHQPNWWESKLKPFGFANMYNLGIEIVTDNEDYVSEYIFYKSVK